MSITGSSLSATLFIIFFFRTTKNTVNELLGYGTSGATCKRPNFEAFRFNIALN